MASKMGISTNSIARQSLAALLRCHGGRSTLCSSTPKTHFSQRPLATANLSTSSTSSQHRQRPDFSSPKQARALSPIIFFTLLAGAGGFYYLFAQPSPPDTLNDITFVPYAVTAREAISLSSFVITITPRTPNPSLPYLPKPSTDVSASSSWRHPLWSVEFKQPEVQISRHYTPLPPSPSEDPADGSLRFYIRTVGDGEMSNYLARRQVGQDVWLRGPHTGFELIERLGGRSRLVFLAGGTGISPGMQAAKAVLDAKKDASVDLLWAVRKREEVQTGVSEVQTSWKFWEQKKPMVLGLKTENPSPVTKQLDEMKTLYGDRLRIQVVIDEENTRFRETDIKATLTAPLITTPPASSSACRLHDQAMHVHASEFAAPEGPGCVCNTPPDTASGKNLFIVSGPDGFIERYAGPKIWLGGQQTQGPVGGVAGQLQRRDSNFTRDWLVLKM